MLRTNWSAIASILKDMYKDAANHWDNESVLWAELTKGKKDDKVSKE